MVRTEGWLRQQAPNALVATTLIPTPSTASLQSLTFRHELAVQEFGSGLDQGGEEWRCLVLPAPIHTSLL
eukprot:m.54222 g.54222  ORF g.54222 m.54222 type:complete len:70 (+) comp11404_c0_seq2:27-236(+)